MTLTACLDSMAWRASLAKEAIFVNLAIDGASSLEPSFIASVMAADNFMNDAFKLSGSTDALSFDERRAILLKSLSSKSPRRETKSLTKSGLVLVCVEK